MNTRTIVIASVAALAMSVGMTSMAATDGQSQAGSTGMMQQAGQEGPGSMGQGGSAGRMMGSQPGNMMDGLRGSGMAGGSGMPGSGMMGACPAMAGAGLNPKTAMQMHGEMMRAMGDVLVKYADKIQAAPAKP